MNANRIGASHGGVGPPCPTGFRRGFTIVELLIVIAVLAILITLIVGVAGRIQYQQRASSTRTLMMNLHGAIEQFQREVPLASLYNRPDSATFGTLPPYQLLLPATYNVNSAPYRLERDPPAPGGGVSNGNLLSDRIARDLGAPAGQTSSYVRFAVDEQVDQQLEIRALYTYLRVFSKAALAAIPENFMRPLQPGERVNPKGSGVTGTSSDQIDVLGFNDAWGVPLDYMIYAKYEWGSVRQSDGTQAVGFRVVDRQPVLLSFGIDAEVWDGGRGRRDPAREIWSQDFPKPYADANVLTGELNPPPSDGPTRSNGWLRLIGKNEVPAGSSTYKYRPQ